MEKNVKININCKSFGEKECCLTCAKFNKFLKEFLNKNKEFPCIACDETPGSNGCKENTTEAKKGKNNFYKQDKAKTQFAPIYKKLFVDLLNLFSGMNKGAFVKHFKKRIEKILNIL